METQRDPSCESLNGQPISQEHKKTHELLIVGIGFPKLFDFPASTLSWAAAICATDYEVQTSSGILQEPDKSSKQITEADYLQILNRNYQFQSGTEFEYEQTFRSYMGCFSKRNNLVDILASGNMTHNTERLHIWYPTDVYSPASSLRGMLRAYLEDKIESNSRKFNLGMSPSKNLRRFDLSYDVPLVECIALANLYYITDDLVWLDDPVWIFENFQEGDTSNTNSYYDSFASRTINIKEAIARFREAAVRLEEITARLEEVTARLKEAAARLKEANARYIEAVYATNGLHRLLITISNYDRKGRLLRSDYNYHKGDHHSNRCTNYNGLGRIIKSDYQPNHDFVGYDTFNYTIDDHNHDCFVSAVTRAHDHQKNQLVMYGRLPRMDYGWRMASFYYNNWDRPVNRISNTDVFYNSFGLYLAGIYHSLSLNTRIIDFWDNNLCHFTYQTWRSNPVFWEFGDGSSALAWRLGAKDSLGNRTKGEGWYFHTSFCDPAYQISVFSFGYVTNNSRDFCCNSIQSLLTSNDSDENHCIFANAHYCVYIYDIIGNRFLSDCSTGEMEVCVDGSCESFEVLITTTDNYQNLSNYTTTYINTSYYWRMRAGRANNTWGLWSSMEFFYDSLQHQSQDRNESNYIINYHYDTVGDHFLIDCTGGETKCSINFSGVDKDQLIYLGDESVSEHQSIQLIYKLSFYLDRIPAIVE